MAQVTSLYDAIGKFDWDEASLACRRNPIEAQTWVRREGADFLPLHSACARKPPLSFVIDLIDAFPEAARAKDDSGMYPLHYACGNRASKAVIEHLVDCFPRAVQQADPQGMLPLHYIAQWGPSEDGVVELLLNEFSEGGVVLNIEGKSPLDLCREANYDDWEKIYALMERSYCSSRKEGVPREISAKSPRLVSVSRERERESRTSSRGRASERNCDAASDSSTKLSSRLHKRRSLSAKTHSNEHLAPPRSQTAFSFGEEMEANRSEIPSARRSAKSPLSSSHGCSQDIEDYREGSSFDLTSKPSSILRKERSSSHDHSEWASSTGTKYDTRDEGSTPRYYQDEYRATPQSLDHIRASSGSHGSQTHSNHSRDNIPAIATSLVSPRYFDMVTPRSSGRGTFYSEQSTPRCSSRVVFDFTNDSTPPSSSPMNNHFVSNRSREKLVQMHALRHQSHENNIDMQRLANENMELRAKLTDYELIQNENTQLRAKLAKMQEVQHDFSRMAEIFEDLVRS